ncbi:kinase-like domain-containing protein, partial [Piptocephalis cylindrospora]
FTSLRQLATGQFGTVSVVKDEESGKTLALKTLDKRYLLRHRERACFMEERDVLVRGSQIPWFPSLTIAFQDTSSLYLGMEFLQGGDLAGLLDRRDGDGVEGEGSGLTEDETRFYLAELILALESLHDLGYAHRDVKPGNVLIDARGHVRLADFGACALIDPETRRIRGAIPVGTPEYVAPEVLRAQEDGRKGYGPDCDLWSVGILAYECLRGISPFWAETDAQTFARVMDHESLICSEGSRYGIAEAKKDPFFAEVTFNLLWNEGRPPFVPDLSSPEDAHYF